MNLYSLRRRQEIDAPVAEVFAFFSKPENLGLITPADLGFRIVTPLPAQLEEGMSIGYVITLFGLPVRWTTLIKTFRPPHLFVDSQLHGPYACWEHTHTFQANGIGTLMTDEVRYALPLGSLGRAVHALIVRRQLRRIFDYRQRAIAALFPGQPRTILAESQRADN